MNYLLHTPELGGALSIGLLVVRIIAGLAFVLHGLPKIQQPFDWMGPNSGVPGIFLALAAIAEFFGGISWLLGLLTRPFSILLSFTMLYASFTHISAGDPFISTGGRAWELPGVYIGIAALLFLAGAGSISLDELLFNRRRRHRY
jgi:putative oxidoreductase